MRVAVLVFITAVSVMSIAVEVRSIPVEVRRAAVVKSGISVGRGVGILRGKSFPRAFGGIPESVGPIGLPRTVGWEGH